jgi:Predicted periplasmic lipoprotein (DUF2279)
MKIKYFLFSLLCFLIASIPTTGIGQIKLRVPYNYTPHKPEWKKENRFLMPDTLLNKKRTIATMSIAGGGYTIAYGTLALAWYRGEPKAPFHFFNDNHEWKGIDKLGHALGGYQGSRLFMQLLKWNGMSRKTVLVLGGLTGFVTLIPLEILDGFTEKWGASPGDLVTDFAGGALAFTNEALWNEQRLQMKVSYHPTAYQKARPNLFGDQWSRYLKDYNGHTIWMSARVHSFLPEGNFKNKYPKWLNVAVGYGAGGMLGGYDNGLTPEIRDREYSQYYLALDLDLSQIKTKSAFLDVMLGILDAIHLPSPTLELNGKFGLRGHLLYM